MGLKHLMEKTRVERERTKQSDEELRAILESRRTQIKVVGAGGAGNNTLTRLMEVGVVGVETIAINTDAQDLLYTDSDKKILIGRELTSGLGAGADPKIGMEAAKESKEEIKKALQGADMVFLTCGLGGGCLIGSSLIYTNPDGPVRIDSIQPGSFVYSLDNDGKLVKRKVLMAMKTGIKKVLEVKTNNHTLYASYDHPFLRVVPEKTDKRGRFSKFRFEWTPAERLKEGDIVVVLRKAPESARQLENEFQVTENFCRLFGFLLGDGWVIKSRDSWKVCFSPSEDEECNKRYVSLIEEIFGVKVKRNKNWYYINSRKIYELLAKFGLNRHAKEKEVPSWVFKIPDSHKKEFILGLADADGFYYKKRRKMELRFEMSSEKLIRQLKVLCNYLGLRTGNVLSRVREIRAPNSKKKVKTTFWSLRIYKIHQLNKSLEKTRQRKDINFLYGYRGPIDSEFFKNFGFIKIKSIKEVGNEEVYDITVEGSHNFVAEGFVVHNTGTGSLPVVAEVAKKLGALTLAIVTLPFSMEGKQRMANAREGLSNLEGLVDTLIVIPNDKLLEIVPDVSLQTAFKVCDEILVNAVKGIAELVTKPGLINLDFADVKAVMSQGGLAMIGMGESDTENRALESVEKALNNPLISVDVNGAKGALINVVGGPDITIKEAQQIVETVSSKLAPDAKIIWGAQVAKELGDAVRTMLIITGVKSPQTFGSNKLWTKDRKKDIEKILEVEFVE